MAIRPGTRTPWREWDGELGPDGDVIFVRDGTHAGDIDLLAEALRTDGVSDNLYHAYMMAGAGTVVPAYYGFVEGSRLPTVCDKDGRTLNGEQADLVVSCVFVLIVSDQ